MRLSGLAAVAALVACQSPDPPLAEAEQAATACTINSQCNDNNACTIDVCNTATMMCTNTPITGCCNTNSDCNDSNACTTDTCNVVTHSCTSTAIPGCCTSNAQCADGNFCTTDACDLNTHTCTHTAIAD